MELSTPSPTFSASREMTPPQYQTPNSAWSEASSSIVKAPQADMDHMDAPPQKAGGRRLRQRKAQSPIRDYIDEVMRPLSDQERREFRGWVELESDPAIFNSVLRRYGVQDVKVQEVLGLDDEMLTFLPKPVYGLIFLFKYRDNDAEQEEGTAQCPQHVWFANQVSPNLCATAALLNIVMNCSEIDLGSNLKAFKDSSQGYPPTLRGQMLSQHQWIRNTHNSFARRMDFLNADLSLSNDVAAWKKRKYTPRKTGTKKKRPRDDDDSSFHFIAFVPTEGKVWRLDGLQNQPVDLGQDENDWIAVARANIYERIAQYAEDGVQFNLLSLCKTPLRSIPEQLAQKMRLGIAIEEALTAALPDWRQFMEGNGSFRTEQADDCFGVNKDLMEAAQLSETNQKQLIDAATDTVKLMDMHRECMRDQGSLKAAYMEELTLINQEDDQAIKRKQDLTPLIYNSIKTLAENGILQDIVAAVAEND